LTSSACSARSSRPTAWLFRAFLLKEQLRQLYHLDDPAQADELLRPWLAWASRSKLRPFVKLARTIRKVRRPGFGRGPTPRRTCRIVGERRSP